MGGTAFPFADCASSQTGELLAQLVLRGSEGIGQAPAKSFNSVQTLAVQNHTQRPFQTDEARQALRASPSRQQTQFHLRQSKLRAWFVENQSIIAGYSQFQSAAQARAADGCKRRHWHSRELGKQLLSARRDGFSAGGILNAEKFLQIGTGDEAALFATAKDQKRRLAVYNAIESSVEIGHHLAIQDIDAAARHIKDKSQGAFRIALDNNRSGVKDLHVIPFFQLHQPHAEPIVW